MKYSPEMTAEICGYIRNGFGRVITSKKVNISYETFTKWMEDHAEFSEAVKKAEYEGRKFLRDFAVATMAKAMEKSWQAAAWWLERNYPDEFAIRQKFEHTGDMTGRLIIKRSQDAGK